MTPSQPPISELLEQVQEAAEKVAFAEKLCDAHIEMLAFETFEVFHDRGGLQKRRSIFNCNQPAFTLRVSDIYTKRPAEP